MWCHAGWVPVLENGAVVYPDPDLYPGTVPSIIESTTRTVWAILHLAVHT